MSETYRLVGRPGGPGDFGLGLGREKVPENDEKIINNQKLINSDLTLS